MPNHTLIPGIRLALTLAILTCAPIVSDPSFNDTNCFQIKSIDIAINVLALFTSVACLVSGLWTYYATQRGYVKRKGITEVGLVGYAAGTGVGIFLIGAMVCYNFGPLRK